MQDRNDRLVAISAELARRGLKPLKKLGDLSKGEIEVVGIKEIYDHSARFFTDVKFEVLFPGGNSGEFTIRFNANGATSDGAVIVVLINGQFVIVKQWRLPLGQWMYEVPRGFGEKLDRAQIQGELGTLKIGDLPLGTLARELGEEVMKEAEVTSVTHLGNIGENSGTSNVVPSYFLVQLQVDDGKLAARLGGSEAEIKVQLWTAERVRSEIGRKLCDNHTITALSLALRHIETLARL
jgi:8-oxo-dGTP pyrophosphatase MutT (NUDIX family)